MGHWGEVAAWAAAVVRACAADGEERWPRRMMGAEMPGKALVGGRRVLWEGLVERDCKEIGITDPWKQSEDRAGWRQLIGRTLSRAAVR